MNLLIPIAAGLLAVASCVLGIALWQLHSRTSLSARLFEQVLAELRGEMTMLGSTGVGMGQRIDRLAGDLRSLRETVEAMQSNDHAPHGSYLHAIRMAERGKDVDELMAVFGVSRAEAELLRKLHPEQKSARH